MITASSSTKNMVFIPCILPPNRFSATKFLIRITARIFFMPRPGGRNNIFEPGKFWFPAEFAKRFFSGGDKFWWIAGASRLFHHRNFFARDLFAHLDDLL